MGAPLLDCVGHGDCHASQFFLFVEEGQWRVSGVVDMEVCSAGDSVEDLLKIGIELATSSVPPDWWEPLFAGYGGEPDFGQFRLRWLGAEGVEFWCQGWKNARVEMMATFLAAASSGDLFAAKERLGTTTIAI